MFTGLSAFPLTPMTEQGVREDEFTHLVARLAAAQVDSIGVLGGLLPARALAITRAAQAGDAQTALKLSSQLEPLWALYRDYGGSLRVIATLAEVLGDVSRPSLPLPLTTLQGEARRKVEQVARQLEER